MKTKDWFTADKQGLADLTMRAIEKRGPGILVAELFQNAMDANATEINIDILWDKSGQRTVLLQCKDNGDGFHDLSHAWTMFAPSIKKDDATKAGRFNVGEKFVMAIAKEAMITTKCGTISFDADGRRHMPRIKSKDGTAVTLQLKLKKESIQPMLDFCDTLIVPEGVHLRVNGYTIHHRKPFRTFEATLPTEIGEELRKTERKTAVELYEVAEGEVGTLYELGIPVVELGDKYHVNVKQKIPLNIDRDNVTPSYAKQVRVLVLNNAYDEIEEADVTTPWVQQAAADKRSLPAATAQVLKVQYGEDALIENPFDKEANAKAVASGRTLIPTRALSRGFRDNLYDRQQVQTSSQVFTKKTLATARRLSRDEWTPRMEAIESLVQFISTTCRIGFVKVLMIQSESSTVADFEGKIVNESTMTMRFNMSHPSMPETTTGIVDLIIHELGHAYESNHLSERYYSALSKIGGQLAVALIDPKIHTRFRNRCLDLI